MKLLIWIGTAALVLLLSSCSEKPDNRQSVESSSDSPSSSAVNSNLHERLYKAYDQYRAASITHRRFKHADVEPLLTALDTPFQVQRLGESVEGRAIYEVQIGSGDTPVLFWSQMHGDEPTATMALLDIFNFFQASGDGFDSLRRQLRAELSLHFIPLLNPDGAEAYERRNALGVDLNRDALRLQSPASKILKTARERTQAVWGFNLHDQSRYYAAGKRPQPAAISFLAPAYNAAKDINEGRGDAMQLIVYMNEILQHYIPGKVGRYDDTFEPRAFGDNMQKWGTNTILIESGGLPDDREKQYLRKLHFTAILAALEAIAAVDYEQAPVEAYDTIPYNASADYHDLVLREVERIYEGDLYITDIAFRLNEVSFNENKSFYLRAHVSDIGDLSTQFGYDELQGTAYRIVPGRTYDEVLPDHEALQQLDLKALLGQGYTTFQLKERPSRASYDQQPVEIVSPGTKPANTIRLYGNPSFVLEKDGQYRYAVINGQLYPL